MWANSISISAHYCVSMSRSARKGNLHMHVQIQINHQNSLQFAKFSSNAGCPARWGEYSPETSRNCWAEQSLQHVSPSKTERLGTWCFAKESLWSGNKVETGAQGRAFKALLHESVYLPFSRFILHLLQSDHEWQKNARQRLQNQQFSDWPWRKRSQSTRWGLLNL